MPPPPPSLADLLAELEAREATLRSCQQARAEASRAETNAVNSLNASQRAVDAMLAGMRSKAPSGSDWNSPRGEPCA